MATSREGTKGAPAEREPQAAAREGTRSAGDEETEQLIFTLRAATGEIIRVEKTDAAGKRGELAKEDAVALVDKQNLDEVEAALDEAFEAGICSVLDPGSEEEAPEETAEEMELRRTLLKLIIGREVRRRLQRRIVQRLILSRTLAH
ncbi:MAG TPA: hypothetical protein VL356_05515 [Acidocella sp.]|jgi:hypothetical protein|nr:hypothetical protein [Acidocella sp.]